MLIGPGPEIVVFTPSFPAAPPEIVCFPFPPAPIVTVRAFGAPVPTEGIGEVDGINPGIFDITPPAPPPPPVPVE
jgi:hypothetical protein